MFLTAMARPAIMRLAAGTATTSARATAAGIIATTGITENGELLSPNAVSEYLTA